MSETLMWTVHVELRTESQATEFEAIVDAFYALEQVDPALLDSSWSLTRGDDVSLVEVDLTVAGSDEDDVWKKAAAAIRTAVHAGGGGTPSWEGRMSEVRHAYLITERQDIVLVAS